MWDWFCWFFLSWVSLAAASRKERLNEKVEGDLRDQMSESEDLWKAIKGYFVQKTIKLM